MLPVCIRRVFENESVLDSIKGAVGNIYQIAHFPLNLVGNLGDVSTAGWRTGCFQGLLRWWRRKWVYVECKEIIHLRCEQCFFRDVNIELPCVPFGAGYINVGGFPAQRKKKTAFTWDSLSAYYSIETVVPDILGKISSLLDPQCLLFDEYWFPFLQCIRRRRASFLAHAKHISMLMNVCSLRVLRSVIHEEGCLVCPVTFTPILKVWDRNADWDKRSFIFHWLFVVAKFEPN